MGLLRGLLAEAGTAAAARTAAAALVAATASCQNPSAPEPIFEDHRVVYGVLRVGSPTVEVLIEEWPAIGGLTALSGATVSVTGLGQTTQLVESAPDGLCQITFDGDFILGRSGCYTATLPEPIAPLETYTLDIVLPDGDVVTGQATTPGVPDFRTTPDTVVALDRSRPDNLPIADAPTELVAAPGAARVDVRFDLVAGAPTPEGCVVDAHVEPFRSPSLFEAHDFYLWRVFCADGFTAWTVLDLRLHAAALDPNYSAYLGSALEGNAFSGRDGVFGVRGAVGVFGAVAVTTAPLVVAYRPLDEPAF